MEITLQKVVLHIFFCQKVKTDIFQNGGGGNLGFMHQRDFKIKLNLINANYTLKSGITYISRKK